MKFAKTIALAGAGFALVATPVLAQINTTALEGQRVRDAERTLTDFGYNQVRTEQKDGDTWVYFRDKHNSHNPCIGLVTTGGRVATALSLGEGECHSGGGDVAGALAGAAIAGLIGAALLGHHDKHHKDDRHKQNNADTAQFERGFQDGLHNGQFINYNHNQAYSDGYAAGARERENKLHSNRYHHQAKERDSGHRVDLAAACAHEADRYWNLRRGSTSTYDVRNTGGGMHTVKVAAGYQTGTCTVSDNGTVRSIMND